MTAIPIGNIGFRWETPTPAPRLAAVFVHGWQGDHRTTWAPKRFFRLQNGLIDYLAADAALPWRYFSICHSAGVFNPSQVDDVAGIVRAFLETYVYSEADAVALIAHSLGGLACRRFLVDEIVRRARKELKVSGLLMYGTPNDGVAMGEAAGFFGSPSAAQMQTYSDTLRRLNEQWLERVTNGGDPAIETDNRAAMVCWNVVGTNDRVVTPASAAHLALLGDVKTIPKDHRSLTKPVSADDFPVRIASDFLNTVSKRISDAPREIASDMLAAEVRQRVETSTWVGREEHNIVLRKLNASSLFRAEIHLRTHDLVCRKDFYVGVRLADKNINYDREVDYDHLIGDGVLGSAVTNAIRQGVDVARLRDTVSVDYVRVRHGGNTYDYQPDAPVVGNGWFLFVLRCPSFPTKVSRIEDLELCLQTTIDLAMGWYTYVTYDTVIESLSLGFSCPFETKVLLHPPLRERATVGDNKIVDGLNANPVHVPGPIAAGSRITWVFRR